MYLSLQNFGIMAVPSKTPGITTSNSHLKLTVYHGTPCGCVNVTFVSFVLLLKFL